LSAGYVVSRVVYTAVYISNTNPKFLGRAMYHFVSQSWKGFAGRASGIMGSAEVEV